MKYFFPVSILAGTIMGAGMFSLPYVFAAAGFWFGVLFLGFFTIVLWFTHTMYADIMLRTDHEPRFVSYVKNYLGKWAYVPAVLVTVFGILLGSTVYLVLSESFAELMGIRGASWIPYAFWVLGSLVLFLNIRNLARAEFVINVGIVIIVLLLFIFGLNGLSDSAPRLSFSLPTGLLFFLPFGPVLFSLAGRSAIPSVLKDMRESGISEKKASRIIFWGTAIPAVLYVLFVVGIFGLSGEVSEDAVSGILRAPAALLAALGILGLLSLFSTYALLGISVKDILHYDFNFPDWLSGAVVVLAPIALYSMGLRDFILLVSVAGGIFFALESVFIAMIWNKLNSLGKPRLLLTHFGTRTAYVMRGVFLVGMIVEIMSILV